MINENMKKVLVSLRSGKFAQTTNTLHDGKGHCCLGVMCEVYEKETGNKLERNELGYIIGPNLNKLPHVKDWVGLVNAAGRNDTVTSLTELNDGHGYGYNDSKTFSEIADFIESEPEGLLV
jgi:hypothetical protein